MASIGAPRAERIKRSLAQSTYITAAWTWFLILAAKAAELVLVASVFVCLSQAPASRPLSPQYDVVVFLAQFVALDIGGLSLNTLADHAPKLTIPPYLYHYRGSYVRLPVNGILPHLRKH